MNPCSQCFLLAHLNRQEANFNWSLPHSAAIYITIKREREREADRHISEKTMWEAVLKRAAKDNKQQTGRWRMREINEESKRSCVVLPREGGRKREGGSGD